MKDFGIFTLSVSKQAKTTQSKMSIEQTATVEKKTTAAERWADISDEAESKSPSYAPPQEHDCEGDESASSQVAGDKKRDEVDPTALSLAETFYRRYRTACLAIQRRSDLQRLYEDTYQSWAPSDETGKTDFSKILFALARGMRVVKVVDRGSMLLWNQENRRPIQRREDSRPPRHFSPQRQRDNHFRRNVRDQSPPQRRPYENRERRQEIHPRRQEGYQYRQDNFNHRQDNFNHRQDNFNHRQDNFNHRQDNYRIHGEEARRPRNKDEDNLAQIVKNQQKMIDTLMKKMLTKE